MDKKDIPPRTIVFAFDALDFRYLDRYRSSLPTFDRIRDDGVETLLRSTFPPWTGSAWPSMYTGVDPSHHGVYGFFRFDGYPNEGELVSRNDVEAPAIWNYLSAQRVPSVVLNVPVTHPAEAIEGVIIPGYIAQEDAPGYPAGVREEVSDAIGEQYRIYSQGEMTSDKAQKLHGYLDLIDLRRRAAIHLLTEHDWQFALIQVQKTDSVVHNFDDDTAFRQVYQAVDELMEAVLDEIEEQVNVVVCSDHGIGPVEGYRIFINEILRRNGYLWTTEGESEPSFGTKKADLVDQPSGDGGGEPLGTQLLSYVGKSASKLGLTPDRVYLTARSLGIPLDIFKRMPNAVRDAASKRVDWDRSEAYCRQHTRLGIRINLEGREPNGVVSRSEYVRVRSDLVDVLKNMETPDGNPAFDFVVPHDEFYEGPWADRGPDIFICPRNMDHSLSTTLVGNDFGDASGHGHKQDGVFLASGPAFEDNFEADRLSLIDVAPVVMASLGKAVPERMMGTAPQNLITRSFSVEQFNDVPFGKGRLTDQGTGEEVTEQLKDLGYL